MKDCTPAEPTLLEASTKDDEEKSAAVDSIIATSSEDNNESSDLKASPKNETVDSDIDKNAVDLASELVLESSSSTNNENSQSGSENTLVPCSSDTNSTAMPDSLLNVDDASSHLHKV